MRHFFIAGCVALIVSSGSVAGAAEADEKPVWRMVYYQLLPGQGEVFLQGLREEGAPIFELAMQKGGMTGYEWVRNPFKRSPEDWDLLLILRYENYAALDRLEATAGAAYREFYGSEEAIQASVERRNASRKILGIQLVERLGGNASD